MAAVGTPAPLRHPQTSFDTPTPAPSSSGQTTMMTSIGKSKSNLTADIKDARKTFQDSLKYIAAKSQQPLVDARGRTQNGAAAPVIGTETLDKELENLSVDDVLTDYTERQRRDIEASIRRGIGEFEDSASSIGFGDLSDIEEHPKEDERRAKRFQDESASDSAEDNYSVQVGMAGTRATRDGAADMQALADSSDDLSYLSFERSPRQPIHQATDRENVPPKKTFSPTSFASAFPPASAQKGVSFSALPRAPPRHTVPTSATKGTPQVPSRLPDITGLTDGLQSPEKVRGHYNLTAKTNKDRDAALRHAVNHVQEQVTQVGKQLSESKQAARNLADNARTSQPQRPAPSTRPTAERTSVDWQSAIEAERKQRQDLEKAVHRLQNQVIDLVAQAADSDVSPAVVARVQALESSMQTMQNDVDGIKGVLELLIEDREYQARHSQAHESVRTEANRVDGLKRRAQNLRDADPDRTPRAREPTVPDTPRSFLSSDEVERLQNQMRREQERRSPTPQHGRFVVPDLPKRPSSAPLMRERTQPRRSRTREESSDSDLETSFRRADAIFDSVEGTRREAESSNAKSFSFVCADCKQRKKRTTRRRDSDDFDGDDEAMHAAHESKKAKFDHVAQLAIVLEKLEADFVTHRNIYIELSNKYKAMDSKESTKKRKTLAEHLKQSVDTLEVKAERVKRLHSLIHNETHAPSDNVGRGQRLGEGWV